MASTTLAQYRTRIASKLGLDNSTSGDQALIDSWLNEAYEEIQLEVHGKVSSGTQALTSGQSDYTLDTAILAILKIYNSASSTSYLMERVPLGDLIDMRRAGTTAGLPPARFYAIESNLLSVYPTPGSGETLTYYYVPRPTAMSASSDTPSDLPSEYHKALEWYALREGADYDDDQSSYLGRYYDQKYQEFLTKIKRWRVAKGGSRLPRATLTRDRTQYLPHDRSQDIS